MRLVLAAGRRLVGKPGVVAHLVVLGGGLLVAVGIGASLRWTWGLSLGGLELIVYGLLFIDDGQKPKGVPTR